MERDVVLADIRQQVAAGAEHITFGDPDFFNGVGHAMPLVEALHREFPELTYDVTIKVEHLRKNPDCCCSVRETGCLFVVERSNRWTTRILEKLEKEHTREDFFGVAGMFRQVGITLQPTFVPFTPWTTFDNYWDLLKCCGDWDLATEVAPIQLAIRLLITAGSRLLRD